MKKSEKLNLWLPEGTDPLDVTKLSENFETLDGASGGEDKRRMVAIKVSTEFVVPSNARGNKFMVLVQGGGGNGGAYDSTLGGGGGGGGHTAIAELTLTPNASIVCTVGSSGGTSSFGNYLVAAGGEAGTSSAGGSGGSGGGAARATSAVEASAASATAAVN